MPEDDEIPLQPPATPVLQRITLKRQHPTSTAMPEDDGTGPQGPVTPAATQPAPRLRLSLSSADGPSCAKLRIANTYLSAGSPSAALNLYTEVLTTIGAGHPYGFLNRSLCYIMLGYPSLAAADAYRAILSGRMAQERGHMNLQKAQISLYTRMAEESARMGERWLQPETAFAGGEHAKGKFIGMPLADLGYCARDADGKESGQSNDIILRGHFRLALSLFLCGAGALRSALDVLSDAQALKCCDEDDAEQFQTLENHILEHIELEFLVEDKDVRRMQRVGSLPKEGSSAAIESYKMKNFRGLLQTRYTKIKRELYPWDGYSLRDHTQSEHLRELNDWVKQQASGCCLRASAREGKVPKLSLHVNRHFAPGSVVLETKSCLHVSSSAEDGPWVFCRSCAAAMHVSESLVKDAFRAAIKVEEEEEEEEAEDRRQELDALKDADEDKAEEDRLGERDNPPKAPAATPIDAPDSPERLELPTREKASHSDQQKQGDEEAVPGDSATPPPPPPHRVPLRPPDAEEDQPMDFQLCPTCKLVAYCDTRCHIKALTHHPPVCGSLLEGRIRDLVNHTKWRGLPGPEQQVLLSLMVLRILAIFSKERRGPLGLPCIRLLDGDLDEPRDIPDDRPGLGRPASDELSQKFDDFSPPPLRSIFHDYDKQLEEGNDTTEHKGPNMIPWSFDVNVRQPIQVLLKIGGPIAALDVKRYDGWAFNTLIAKLEAHMRITEQPRFVTIYDSKGNVAGPEGSDSDAEEPDPPRAWIASLHCLSSLIPAANPVQTPNVRIQEQEANLVTQALVHIYPGQGSTGPESDDRRDSLTTSGQDGLSQPLLREKDILPYQEGRGMSPSATIWNPTRQTNQSANDGGTMADANETTWGISTSDAVYEEDDMDVDVEQRGDVKGQDEDFIMGGCDDDG